MKITTERDEEGIAVVSLSGELDMFTQEDLARELDSLVDDDRNRQVGIDLEEVEFVDSAGIRLLQEVSSKMRQRGRELVLKGASPQVQRAITLLTAAGLLNL